MMRRNPPAMRRSSPLVLTTLPTRNKRTSSTCLSRDAVEVGHGDDAPASAFAGAAGIEMFNELLPHDEIQRDEVVTALDGRVALPTGQACTRHGCNHAEDIFCRIQQNSSRASTLCDSLSPEEDEPFTFTLPEGQDLWTGSSFTYLHRAYS